MFSVVSGYWILSAIKLLLYLNCTPYIIISNHIFNDDTSAKSTYEYLKIYSQFAEFALTSDFQGFHTFAIKILAIFLNKIHLASAAASVFIRPVFASYWTLPIQLTYEYTKDTDTRFYSVPGEESFAWFLASVGNKINKAHRYIHTYTHYRVWDLCRIN